jgi:UDP-glucose 4-epimerase
MEFIQGDFTNAVDLERAVDGCTSCVHLVSTTLPKSSNLAPAYDVESNLVGTIRLLELAVRRGMRKVVFVSSGGTVYGIPRSIPIVETDPTEPISSYGITKLAIEKYLHLFHVMHGLDYSILRLSNPYGEGQRLNASQGAVAVFMGKVLDGEPIEIWVT